MRVRITRRMSGTVDGVSLERFQSGATYEISASLATYLIVNGAATSAEEAAAPTPPRSEPIDTAAGAPRGGRGRSPPHVPSRSTQRAAPAGKAAARGAERHHPIVFCQSQRTS